MERNLKNPGQNFTPFFMKSRQQICSIFFQKTHGGPLDYERHVGDLGNIFAYHSKISTRVFKVDHMISLIPDSEANIIDRALVIHAGEDDIGRGGNEESKKTGNAGARVACGIVKAN